MRRLLHIFSAPSSIFFYSIVRVKKPTAKVQRSNIVAVRWTLSGTNEGEFMGMPATGKHFSTSVMNFYYFNDEGKIINDIAAEGMIGILRGIGMLDK